MDDRPIGVFDSGLGGLTVIREIKKILPKERIVYLGDTARVPYGTRGKETVIKFSLENTRFLGKFDIKCLVIACNTSSAMAYDEIRRSVKIPVIEMITPAAAKAVRTSRTKRIGVIGTKGTITSHAYRSAISKIDKACLVYEYACPLFVPLVEEGELSGGIIGLTIKKYLAPLKKNKIDTLILGCTHYPIISGLIKKEMGKKIGLINPGREAARYLYKLLVSLNSLSSSGKVKVEDKYYLTDVTSGFITVAEKYLKMNIFDKVQKA